jgi:hypothetical protein
MPAAQRHLATESLAPQPLVPEPLPAQPQAPELVVPQPLVPQALAPESLTPQTLAPDFPTLQSATLQSAAPQQPAPRVQPPLPVPDPVAQKATEQDWSMDQFEAQFTSPSNPLAPADFSGDFASPVSSGSRFAPQADASGSTQVQVQSAPVATVTETTKPGATASAAKPSTADAAFAASTATAKVTNGRRNRKRVLSSVRGMIAGLLFVLVGAALIFMATAQNSAPSGQLRAAGIITSLGHPAAGCAPVARFAAAGGSYTAKSAPFAPCPVQLGESVNVFYSPQHPGTTGFISVPSSISTIDWAVTGIGVVLLVGSAIAFFVRAGSVSRAAAVVRAGDERELARSVTHP